MNLDAIPGEILHPWIENELHSSLCSFSPDYLYSPYYFPFLFQSPNLLSVPYFIQSLWVHVFYF